jgi:hypothetical protein
MSGISNGQIGSYNQVAQSAEDFAIELTGDEVAAAGGKVSPVTLDDVKLADVRVRATGVLEKLQQWRHDDAGTPGVGGRPAILNDRIILICLLILVTEKTPQWISEISNLLAFRLTPDARAYLGLPAGSDSPGAQSPEEKKRWYNNTRNTFQRMLKPMDPYPQRRALLDLDARKCALDNLDTTRVGICKTRLDWFSNAFLQMSFMMQTRAVRRADMTVNISFDQTYVAPVGLGSYTAESDEAKRAIAAKEDTPTTAAERKALNKLLGERGVLEVHAGFYVTNAEKRDAPDKASSTEMKWGWAANVAVRVTADPSKPAPFPLIVMALTLSIPGIDVTEEAVLLMESVASYGHTPGYAAADNQYWANSTLDRLHRPGLKTGFQPLTRYRINRLGVKGGHAGAQQIEGAHYCPAMPDALKTASQDVSKALIDDATYRARINERSHFVLRNKERPAEDGSVPKMCPAHGPGATVTCPLRPAHPNSSKKSKPAILQRNLPAKPGPICTQTSVKFTGDEDMRYGQALTYGTQEHEDMITTARNSAEGTFGQLRNAGHENLSSAARRSSRGYAAAQVFVTLLLVAFNMRRIAAFQSQLDRPKKIYESKSNTFYTPYTDKRKMIRAEKAAAALAAAEALKLDPPTRS